jgi:hypothetical protein
MKTSITVVTTMICGRAGVSAGTVCSEARTRGRVRRRGPS